MTGFVQARPYETGQSALGTMQDIEQTRQLQQRTGLGDLEMQMEQLKAQRAAEQYRIQQEMLKTLTPEQRLAFSYAPEQTGQALAKRLYPDYVNVGRQGSVYDPQQNKVVYQSPDIEGVQWQGAPGAPGANLAGARPPTVPQPQSSQTFAPGATGAPVPLGYAGAVGNRENRTGNPAARNPNSSAMGNHQFLKGTWLDVIRTHRPDLARGKTDAEILRMREQPALSAEMAENYARDNTPILVNAGFQPTTTNLAILHGFGPTGGLRILQAERANPNTQLATVLSPEALQSNPELRGLTIAQGRALLEKQIGGGGAPPNGQATPQPNGQATPTPTPAQTADAGGWETATKGGLPANTGAKPGTYWQRRKTGVDAQGRPTYEYRTSPEGGGEGPFGSNAIDANAYNILLTGDPGTQEYALAYYHATQPKYIQVADPNDPSRMITKAVTPELPPNIRRPTWTPPAQVAADGTTVQPGQAPAVSTPPATASAIPGTEKGGGPSASERKALKDAEVEVARVREAIKVYRDTIDKTGGPSWTSFAGIPTSDAVNLNTAYNNLALLVKGDVLYQLGVLNGPDLDIVRRTLLDPSTLKAWAADPEVMKEQISQIESLITKGLEAKRQQFGGGAGGDAGSYAGMDRDALLAVDPTTIPADQKAAYLAALRAQQ